ncbi:MAG TPA: MFS transporter [Pseudomonas sabulinigri]|uniref:Major facilitator superfamily (MFS) profile domain-containing protein n=1 Tax=marine sediment metagenome TaxID=412755 RepID=A0A0F9XXC9_9ZZZZ|nr:MFS transporter [Halopseudomonas sabulinigri]HEC50871.1 MFS transporter [Halopseudomonas sabulinigri]
MPLSRKTKFAYGVGQIAETVKSTGFNIFLFFFFTQVLGLSGSLAGLAVMIALVFDAVTDPLAGYISDHSRSRFGRRHPFMLAAALPLGIAWYFLFTPPDGLGQTGLFLWLTGFAVLVRGAITLYYVPYLGLGAELTLDYHERTSVAAWRGFCGVSGAAVVVLLGVPLFFPETATFENGLLNPAGYPLVALFGALLMAASILLSAWGTRGQISALPTNNSTQNPLSLRENLFSIWRNSSFRALFLGTLLVAISIGITQTLNMHLNVYFWGLTSNNIALLGAGVLLGWPVGILLTKPLHQRFDKKPTIIGAALVAALASNIAVVLALLGMFPSQSSALFVPLILLLLFVGGAASGLAMISGASMMADVAQQHADHSGQQQEGFFFSAISFTGKMAAAAGYLVAGIGLDLIGFPLQASPSEVSITQVNHLAMLSLSAGIFAFASACTYTRYQLRQPATEAVLC